ncbi:MAG: helix-turn-helix domain-containing protein [Thermodesulfobacteriota bacterium]
MVSDPIELSVSQAARLLGVNRNTIGSWIRSDKLRVHRVGKNYQIPVDELIYFLKSTGQKVPKELASENLKGPYFRRIQRCYQFFEKQDHGKDCGKCTVYKNELEHCFTGKEASHFACRNGCDECQYFLEYYYNRIQFIHQIASPAAVCKDLFFWSANRKWAELCQKEEKEMVGVGIENIYHADSLRTVISNQKKRMLGDQNVSSEDIVYIRNHLNGRRQVKVANHLLNEPSGAWLLLAETVR